MKKNRLIPPLADYGKAVDFLERFAPDDPWVLTAIHPYKETAPEQPNPSNTNFITTRTFDEQDDMYEWLVRYGAHRNVYFHVNPVMTPVRKKASCDDIRELAWLHVDVDPRIGEDLDDERERILGLMYNPPEGVPEPTCIVFSGGGYQAFWRLAEPMVINGQEPAYEEAKRYNLQLELRFGADSCHSIDHIMRLPGTLNRPDAKKKRNGRELIAAEVIEWRDHVYPLDEFEKAPLLRATPHAPTATPEHVVDIDRDNVPRIDNLGDLPKGVRDSARLVISQGRDPDDPNRHGDSRSEWLRFACCELVRAGCSDEQIYGIITDPEWGISASVLDKGKTIERYATRQIQRAREVAAADDEKMAADDDGKPYQSLQNFRLAVKLLGVRLEYDDFAARTTIHNLNDLGPFLDDDAFACLFLLLEERFQLKPGKDKFEMILNDMARKNTRHPVCEYLEDLNWDGTPRVDTMLSTYFSATDTELHRAFIRLVMVAACRRVREPGCKFDEMLVLESSQGTEKSGALAALAGRREWFSDSLYLGTDTKKQLESTDGRWIVEAAELNGMSQNAVEGLKAWLSRGVDRARMSYKRFDAERPRQFIVIGTTNEDTYLRDTTGNRRFWPVRVGTVDVAAIRRDRDQLWAEAAAAEAAGESIRLNPRLWESAAEVQEAREVEDPFVQLLGEALGTYNIPVKIRIEDVWTILGVPRGQRTQAHNARLCGAMRKLGWKRTTQRFDGKVMRCYINGIDGTAAVPRVEVVVTENKPGHVVARIEDGVDDEPFA